jgi:protease I
MHSHELTERYQAIPPGLKASLTGTDYLLPEFEDQDSHSLEGFRAALITTHGPELPEFHVPLGYLRDRGASVDVVAPDWLFEGRDAETAGLIVLAQWLAVNVCARADKKISDARVGAYDAVILLGGAWNPIMLRTHDPVLKFVAEAHRRGMLIAAICHGPQVLISSNAFPARTRATGVDDIKDDLTNAGFVVENDVEVVYDEAQRLITARNPDALKGFCEEIGRRARYLLKERP